MDTDETTKWTPSFRDSAREEDRKFLLNEIRSKHLKPSGAYRGEPYYCIGDVRKSYVVLVQNGEIVYFVRVKQIQYNEPEFGGQILVCRERIYPSAYGFAFFVFFKLLLPKHKALLADQEQTQDQDGQQRFWSNAIAEAFDRNLYVYAFDRRPTPNTLTQLHNRHDADKNKDKLWDKTEGQERIFAVISQVPLKLKSGYPDGSSVDSGSGELLQELL